MAVIEGLLETFILADDLDAARSFYEDVLGLPTFGETSERGCLFLLPGDRLLGILDREAARSSNPTPGGRVPPCLPPGSESRGPGTHLAFAIPASELAAWRARLRGHRVEILEEVEWERGGRSLYFRDPEGNLLELATPGVWSLY